MTVASRAIAPSPDEERDRAGIAPDAVRAFAFELSELKRLHCHEDELSVAGALFAEAWERLARGDDPDAVRGATVAAAIVAIGLGPLRLALLAELVPDAAERGGIVARAFEAGCPTMAPALRARLGRAVPDLATATVPPPGPGFVVALLRQPRAGATSPGKPRLTLLPQENHGEHCLAVAVLGAVLADSRGADPTRAFLAGLAHHLHNARLPDTGFAGEVLLGATLDPLMARLTAEALASLPEALRARVADALALVGDAASPDGRAFNAADVIDRVVQVHFHARMAGFSAGQALDDLEIVHEGPMQAFGRSVLAETGLL